jgi:hypothetical protein
MPRAEQGAATARAGLIGVLALLAAGCGGAGNGEPSADGRLNGEWEIALTVLPGAFARGESGDTATVRGTLAFVPNDARTRVPGFGSIPQQIGTHNLRLNRVVPELSSPTTSPIAAGASAGDSVRTVLDPEAGEPIVLRGIWQGSNVTGQWSVHRRAGIDQEGRFSLRRPPP